MLVEDNNMEAFPPLEKSSAHNYFKEQIVNLYYNITRKKSETGELENLSIKFHAFVYQLKVSCKTDPSLVTYVELIYKMIAETRDCFYGKGEHDISYMLIFVFYKYYPVLATYLIHKFVQPLENGSLGKVGYGSWRDIKYLCQYVREHSSKKEKDSIIEICVALVSQTLHNDLVLVDKPQLHPCEFTQREFNGIKNLHSNINYREYLSSLVKWIPREHKKFDWLHELLVIHWFTAYRPDFFGKVKDYEGYYMALDKAKMLYRKMVSKINYYLDTTEIKLCEKQLHKIKPNNVPQLCMNNNNHLFLNTSFVGEIETGVERSPLSHTIFTNKEVECYHNMKEYFHEKFIIKKVNRGHSMKIPNSGKLSYFVKEAYYLIENHSSYNNQDIRIDILNSQWKNISEIIGGKLLDSFIPLLDLSFHHDMESLYSGIALALLISENSSYKHRILIIDHQPLWINLEQYDTFFSRMLIFHKLVNGYHGTTPNFLKGMNLLLDSFIETSTIDQLPYMTLVFLHGEHPVEYKEINELYYTKGMLSTFNRPLPCSRFIYWNLSQNYIDNIIFDHNCFYLSGLSYLLLLNLHLLKNRSLDAFQLISTILGKVYYDDIKISRFIL